MGGGGSTSSTTYYNYQLSLPHQSISPDYPIYCYDAYGILVYTVEPNDPHMNYGTGTYTVPGSSLNETIESISTASYQVCYSTQYINIDYNNVIFYIDTNLLRNPAEVVMWATFEYWATFTAANDTGKIIDGDWSTQMQTIFYAPPPDGYQYAILNLGSEKPIQAVDLLCGYYRPDGSTKFTVNYKATLKYSLNGVDFYSISTDCTSFDMSSGDTKSFTEDELGVDFKAHYILIQLESVDKINYSKSSILVSDSNYQQLVDAGLIDPNETGHPVSGDTIIIREGMYAVALTEASAYSDLIIKAESKLIPTTVSSSGLVGNAINVLNTTSFTNSGTAYIGRDELRSFTYTGKTLTSFTGVTLGSGVSVSADEDITQTIEDDNSIYDPDGLLDKMGDRVFKKDQSNNDDYKYTQDDLNYLSKEYLKEFYKNHGKKTIEMIYAPYLKFGQTVEYKGVNYFIESVSHHNESTTLTLARYPA